ncbi:hypothetical protein L6452_05913 [Arctium lappa]|uniref:Uncharacterized protein n=1 Tax=Arctium lappa TaxID=4217 RepID=A0ACB9EIE7_ARCLA|nr:hypothetical protein L6452_05913 [Arctium lappa]
MSTTTTWRGRTKEPTTTVSLSATTQPLPLRPSPPLSTTTSLPSLVAYVAIDTFAGQCCSLLCLPITWVPVGLPRMVKSGDIGVLKEKKTRRNSESSDISCGLSHAESSLSYWMGSPGGLADVNQISGRGHIWGALGHMTKYARKGLGVHTRDASNIRMRHEPHRKARGGKGILNPVTGLPFSKVLLSFFLIFPISPHLPHLLSTLSFSFHFFSFVRFLGDCETLWRKASLRISRVFDDPILSM